MGPEQSGRPRTCITRWQLGNGAHWPLSVVEAQRGGHLVERPSKPAPRESHLAGVPQSIRATGAARRIPAPASSPRDASRWDRKERVGERSPTLVKIVTGLF